jgi:PAS domain-containing protein
MGPDAVLVVPDALQHPELCSHPMVTDSPRIRFFAGATICDGTGTPIGAVGAMDVVPRDPPTPSQMVLLRHAARLAGDLFDQITARRAQAEQLALLRLTEEIAGLGHWRFDLVSGKVDWSDEVYRIHGRDKATFDPNYADVLADYHPEDRQILEACVERAAATGDGYNLDLRLISPTRGERRVTTRAATQRDETGKSVALYGAFRGAPEGERGAVPHDERDGDRYHRPLQSGRDIPVCVALGRDDPGLSTRPDGRAPMRRVHSGRRSCAHGSCVADLFAVRAGGSDPAP